MALDVGVKRDWTWYIPDFKNNRDDLKPEEQLIVEILPLDHKGKTKWGKKIKTFAPPGGQRASKRYAEETNAVAISRDLFCAHTREVRNCIVNEVEITTGEDLYNADGVDSDLIYDITQAIHESSILGQGIVKNS